MLRIGRLIGCIALAALPCIGSSPANAAGEQAGRFTVGRYLELQSASYPQISPDGKQVVYTRTMVDKMADTPQTAVWIVGIDGTHHRFLAKGSGAVWSPDSKSIAYLADAQGGGTQIFVLHLDVPGPASQITSGPQTPANLHWSPDGRSIGFSMVVPNPEKWPIDLPAAPEGAKWAAAPRFTERLHYRRDHVGLTERGFRHLFLVAADGGQPRQVTSGDWSINESVYEYVDPVEWAFTPDGRSAIVEGFKEGDPDRNDQECYIYLVDLTTGATRRLITSPGGWRRPAISPDGKSIAYVGFPKNGDGIRISDLYTMSADGSNVTLRSGGFDREPDNLVWAADGSAVYFTAEDHGSVHLYSWSAKGGIKQLTQGAEVVKWPSVSRGGVVAVRIEPNSPGDIEIINPHSASNGQRLTHLNDELLRDDAARPRLMRFGSTRAPVAPESRDGWLNHPASILRKRYPLLLEIHGGPYGMYDVAFNASRSRISRPTATWCCTSIRAARPATATHSRMPSRSTIRVRTTMI